MKIFKMRYINYYIALYQMSHTQVCDISQDGTFILSGKKYLSQPVQICKDGNKVNINKLDWKSKGYKQRTHRAYIKGAPIITKMGMYI